MKRTKLHSQQQKSTVSWAQTVAGITKPTRAKVLFDFIGRIRKIPREKLEELTAL